MGWIEISDADFDSSIEVSVTYQGWDRLESWQREGVESNQGFVAMNFDPSLDDAYDQAIAPAIQSQSFNPMRVDKSIDQEKIDNRILREIKDSRFVVADFTGQKAGVYFEAGYAIGLGRPIIWAVKQDDVDNLHFDTRQYPHIVWSDHDSLRTKLEAWIEVVAGRGHG